MKTLNKEQQTVLKLFQTKKFEVSSGFCHLKEACVLEIPSSSSSLLKCVYRLKKKKEKGRKKDLRSF